LFADVSYGPTTLVGKSLKTWPLNELPQSMKVQTVLNLDDGLEFSIRALLGGGDDPDARYGCWVILDLGPLGTVGVCDIDISMKVTMEPLAFSMGISGIVQLYDWFIPMEPLTLVQAKAELIIGVEGFEMNIGGMSPGIPLVPDEQYPVYIGPISAGVQLKIPFGEEFDKELMQQQAKAGFLDDLPIGIGISAEIKFSAFANLFRIILRDMGLDIPGISEVIPPALPSSTPLPSVCL
jgi:hypothetical protein